MPQHRHSYGRYAPGAPAPETAAAAKPLLPPDWGASDIMRRPRDGQGSATWSPEEEEAWMEQAEREADDAELTAEVWDDKYGSA